MSLDRIKNADRLSIGVAIEEYGPESTLVQYRNYLLSIWGSISDKKTSLLSYGTLK